MSQINEYKYGTSGFRFHHTIIESIATKIGNIVANLSTIKGKRYGIMITASHNPYLDNGVKIINENGEMIDSFEEEIITSYVNKNISIFGEILKLPEIYLGYDTRESSPKICSLIIEGILEYNQKSIIHNIEYVSTPELHYTLYASKHNKNNTYIDYLNMLIKKIEFPRGIICDCANGVGSNVLNKIPQIDYKIKLINTKTKDFSLLNKNSGSDYVVNNKKIPYFEEQKYVLYASLDGDADRVVFYYKDANKFNLLNGDKISALIALYISRTVENLENVAVIHTGYSNKAFLDYINKLGIQTICTATGVKNLHCEALKYDISIYFESNGHGTVLFNKKYYELSMLQKFFHPTIGDGVMDMFAILFILQEMGISINEWNNLYTDNPYNLFKIEVKNKDEFETTKDELRLKQPHVLQNYIDKLCKKYDVNAFIRPSGTENYIRVYVESKYMKYIKYISNKLTSYVNHYDNSEKTFTKNDELFIINDLCYDDYNSNYLYLMKQLTSIEPESMTYYDFCEFVDNLNENHKIKTIKQVSTNKFVGSITILIEQKLIHNFGKVAHIEDVVVDESLRGYGMGKKLLEIAKYECVDCYKIILDCSDENTTFYEKCGYVRKGNEMALYLN